MSLTALIRHDKELQERVRGTFKRPRLDRSRELLVEPSTSHYGLVGTAFDYLFRFYVERINSGMVEGHHSPWVAEKAVELIAPDPALQREAKKIVKAVKALKEEYLKAGVFSDELIRAVLRMSYLDPVSRAGIGADFVGTDADPADIEDLKAQLALIPEDAFLAQKLCYLNPSFGNASVLAGGADADLLLDDVLIDIKSTKKRELKFNDFCQIICYFCLYQLGGIDGRHEFPISQLGFYFSRFQYLLLFSPYDLADEHEWHDFAEWLHAKIGGGHWRIVDKDTFPF